MPTDPRRYQRVAAALRERIASGELASGEPMPGTRTISQQYEVSMETAQKALRVLADEGLIMKWPGLPYHVV